MASRYAWRTRSASAVGGTRRTVKGSALRSRSSSARSSLAPSVRFDLPPGPPCITRPSDDTAWAAERQFFRGLIQCHVDPEPATIRWGACGGSWLPPSGGPRPRSGGGPEWPNAGAWLPSQATVSRQLARHETRHMKQLSWQEVGGVRGEDLPPFRGLRPRSGRSPEPASVPHRARLLARAPAAR